MKLKLCPLLSCDNGDISLFCSLGLFHFFDTVESSSLLKQLETSFGISDYRITFIVSHLSNRSPVAFIDNFYSTSIRFGVLQNSTGLMPL